MMFLIGNKGEINVIKFNYAIHKETKTVIPYETFLERYNENREIYLPISNQDFLEVERVWVGINIVQ